jgi:hypothetical protein
MMLSQDVRRYSGFFATQVIVSEKVYDLSDCIIDARETHPKGTPTIALHSTRSDQKQS